jgi:tetratricopeptide (TPR) repeat protein
MSRASRERVETLQLKVEELLAKTEHRGPELREAFGLLGHLFHTLAKPGAAETCYENARSLAPEDARWPFYLGLIRAGEGRLVEAVESYRTALELQPGQLATMLRLANTLLDLGRVEEARIYFDSVLRRDQENPAALFGLGRIADLEGDPQLAVELFERVLALQESASSVRGPLARAYRSLGELEKAKLHQDRQGDRPVAFPDPLTERLAMVARSSILDAVGDLAAEGESFSEESLLAFVLSQLGPVQGAAEQLEKFLQRLEKSGESTLLQRGRIEYAIGGLLVAQDRDEQAIPHFQRAVARDPDLRDARVKLGNALARQRKFADAVRQFDRALQIRGDDPQVLSRRASALVNLERPVEARADLIRVVELEPTNPEGWRLLAGLEERLEEVEAAVAGLERAIELSPEGEPKMALHKDLGDLYHRRRQFESSAREYLKALRIDEGYVPALERLAALLGQLGEYERSAEVYGKWIAREPKNVKARLGEATALILARRLAAARERLEAGLRELPESLDLKDLLARHLAASPDPAVRDGRRALELARELYEQVPTTESMETLAMAHAEAGQLEEAISWQKRLLETADEDTPAEQLERWRANLKLYERGRPCCAGATEG